MYQEFSRYEDIYASLSRDRVIFIAQDVTKELSSLVCALLLYHNAINNQADIHMHIHTNGGDSDALVSIYDVMSLISAPIVTVGLGKIYSAGAFLLASGTPGKRFMLKNAEVMIHGLQCSYPESPVSDQIDSTSYFNYLNTLNKSLLRVLAKHTGQTLAKITKDSQRDLYLDARASLKYGLIDKIL